METLIITKEEIKKGLKFIDTRLNNLKRSEDYLKAKGESLPKEQLEYKEFYQMAKNAIEFYILRKGIKKETEKVK